MRLPAVRKGSGLTRFSSAIAAKRQTAKTPTGLPATRRAPFPKRGFSAARPRPTTLGQAGEGAKVSVLTGCQTAGGQRGRARLTPTRQTAAGSAATKLSAARAAKTSRRFVSPTFGRASAVSAEDEAAVAEPSQSITSRKNKTPADFLPKVCRRNSISTFSYLWA